MYSGAYPASLKGLMNVYDWAIAQQTTPLYLSEYALRARALYETGVARTLDGQWQVTSTGVSSVRLPEALGYPSGNQIAGWNKGPDGKFLILKQPKTRFNTTSRPNKELQLESANGKLVTWEVKGNKINWSVSTHMPLKMVVKGAKQCRSVSGTPLKTAIIGEAQVKLSSSNKGLLTGTMQCQTL